VASVEEVKMVLQWGVPKGEKRRKSERTKSSTAACRRSKATHHEISL